MALALLFQVILVLVIIFLSCGVCAIICAGRSWQEGLADAEGETKVIKPQNDNEGLG